MNLNNSTVEYVYSIHFPDRKVCIKVQEDGSNIIKHIPISVDNADYQEILEWVAEGNTITDNGGGE
jgi:hypothetical protein